MRLLDSLVEFLVDPKAGRIPSVCCNASTFHRVGRLKWLSLAAGLGAIATFRLQHWPFEWVQLAVLLPFAVLHFMPFVVKNGPLRGSDDIPQVVFTLVHGTFALDAPWTRSDSLLCTTLSEQFGGQVAFESFQWTGGNRMRDRTDAALELRDFLLHVVARYPRSRVIVIAHSHGGNVSRAALAALPSPESIAGLVCLSTPFLILHPRALGPRGMASLKGIIGAPIYPFIWWFAGAMESAGSSNVLRLTVIAAGIIGFLLFFVAAPLVVAVLVARAGVLLATEPARDPVPLLLIRSTSDEASMALLAMQFGGLLTQKVWHALTFCAAPFARLATSTTTSKSFIFYGQLGYLFLTVSVLGLAAIGIVAFVPMLATLLFMNVAGAGIGISGLILEVSVEAAPEGFMQLLTLPSPVAMVTIDEAVLNERGADVQLAHSVHSRPEVGECIANWASPLLPSSTQQQHEDFLWAMSADNTA